MIILTIERLPYELHGRFSSLRCPDVLEIVLILLKTILQTLYQCCRDFMIMSKMLESSISVNIPGFIVYGFRTKILAVSFLSGN